ncbi:MAG: S1C family serine protease [Acidimicrobiales bacterium]
MENGEDFVFGEFSDEPGIPLHDRDNDYDYGPGRGWIDPDDRLWRHPSELGAMAMSSPVALPTTRRTPRWAVVGAAMAGVVVAAGAALAAVQVSAPTSSTDRLTTDTSAVMPLRSGPASVVASAPDVVQVVDGVLPSMVSVVVGSGASARHATGVVLPGGNVVATAAGVMGRATKVHVTDAEGLSQLATVAGSDDRAGVAAVQLSHPLTPADFDDALVAPHTLALTACLCASSASHWPQAAAAVGMISSAGTGALSDGGPSLVDAIEAEAPLGASPWGSVLLDDHGRVLGLLDGARSSGGDTFGYFVPAALVVGVGSELALHHKVLRGWLGVVGADASGGGAALSSILAGSPAARAGLQPGDVVEAVDHQPVGSLADLQAAFYMTPPGTTVVLTVVRKGTADVLEVTAGTSPS